MAVPHISRPEHTAAACALQSGSHGPDTKSAGSTSRPYRCERRGNRHMREPPCRRGRGGLWAARSLRIQAKVQRERRPCTAMVAAHHPEGRHGQARFLQRSGSGPILSTRRFRASPWREIHLTPDPCSASSDASVRWDGGRSRSFCGADRAHCRTPTAVTDADPDGAHAAGLDGSVARRPRAPIRARNRR